MIFSSAELVYLTAQPLGRLATVAPDGQVQNNPVNFVVDPGTGAIMIGGGAMGASKKFRNVQAGSTVSFVVDDLISTDPWKARGIEIRGTAEALVDQDPPMKNLSREYIRITPARIVSWNIDGPRASRSV
ncbi:PPOX class F420-dependent oxidoreductase [Actinomadura rupiterrae]|uniref:PPOX class F420-dependent oxidoreductase n=1 Tax=Actinomadura rupiterrae TaxID=559627 RepID=UPI0020A5445B|nr:PPOX class F420-dependent oxidoreductase [Actinomadura rupiterrae]MCP2340282.1 pyridoxamine 5'-phosphate oxidase family protein [Actinomadura rupiterrae]